MTARYLSLIGSGTEEYFDRTDTCGITDYPFSMAIWFQHDDNVEPQVLMGFCHHDTTTTPTTDRPGAHQGLRSLNSDAGGQILTDGPEVISQSATGGANETFATVDIGPNQLVVGQWYAVVGTWTSDTRRDIYFYDPVNDTYYTESDTTSMNFATGAEGLDSLRISGQNRQEPDWQVTGGLKNAALWSVALTEDEAKLYLSGLQAGAIQSANLAGWWKLDEASGNALDSSGNSRTLTASTTITATEPDPRVLVDDSGTDATNLTSKTVNFLDYNDVDYAGNVVPGLSGKYVATVAHTDNNGGSSAESADSSIWEIELVEDSGVDAVNLTSYTSGTLAADDYFATVQHTDDNGGTSLESVPDTFSISTAKTLSGTVQSQSAALSGSVDSFTVQTLSGAIASQSSTVSGSITSGAIYTLSGGVSSQAASVNGSMERAATFSGSVVSQTAIVSGGIERAVSLSGSVQAGSSVVSGTVTVGNVNLLSGTVLSQRATLSGSIERSATLSGGVQAQSSGVSGVISRLLEFQGSVQSQNASITGAITRSGDEVLGGGNSKKKKREEEYKKAFNYARWRKQQRQALQKAVSEQESEPTHRPILKLKKKAFKDTELNLAKVKEIAQIENDIDRQLAIEYQLQNLEFKRKENEALAILLLL